MAAPVTLGSRLELGVATPLFPIETGTSAEVDYDVSPDGQRFIVNVAVPGAASGPTVLTDWVPEKVR